MAELTLKVMEGPDAGRTVALVGELEIGRDPGAGLSLVDDLVSRHHARIRAEAGAAVIEDLGSSNGTFVNDAEIHAPTRLAPGDELLIGACLIQLCAEVSAPAAATASPPAAPPPPAPPPAAPPPAAPPPAAPPPAAPPLVVGARSQTSDDVPVEVEQEVTARLEEDPRIGSELAGYRIEALIGRGGMGVVYRAEHLRLGRKVALKLLPPELAENEAFRVRFESESRLAAAIDHPHIIPLYEAGDAEGLLFLTMRFVDGLDLKALIEREGPLPLERAVSIIGQVGGALDVAHERGLVHRDVKPANVLVASGAGPEVLDHCYLTDFGLTKDTSAATALTAAGQFVGTIDYIAPEQIQGNMRGGAADQYALGCVLYECLTGHPPFERATELDVMWAHLNDEPPSAVERRPALPKKIDGVLARAMAKAPEDRYPDCTGIAAAARDTLSERRRRRR